MEQYVVIAKSTKPFVAQKADTNARAILFVVEQLIA
jgi:hypothetical protein